MMVYMPLVQLHMFNVLVITTKTKKSELIEKLSLTCMSKYKSNIWDIGEGP